MTLMNNTVNTLEFGEIGPKAQINVNGNVGTMTVRRSTLAHRTRGDLGSAQHQ